MRQRCVAIVAAALPLFRPFTLSLPAQQPIRVVRHAPVDTARAGDVITISFDRPVAGSVERSANPERFVRIEPPVPAVVQWRDLVTLRVIPNEPLPPSRRFRVTVDTTFTAMDGGRLAAPYQFTLVTRGPVLLGSVPPLSADPRYPTTLAPGGHLTLVYSAPIDTSLLAKTVRVQLEQAPGCERQVIQYAVTLQRAVVDTNDYGIRAIGGYSEEPEVRFRRLVELRPRAPMPEQCRGTLFVPSLDPNEAAELRYPLASAGPFSLAALVCGTSNCEPIGSLSLSFTAPVRRDSLLGRIHLEPATPFTIAESDAPSGAWNLQLTLTPRTTYRVRVDSTVHDVFGRPLTGTTASVTIGDRRPAIGHQLGFFTVSRRHPVLRVTHVNIDSARIAFIPIPDSMRTSLLLALADADSVARMVSRMRDSVKLDVAFAAALNEERITEVPIPTALLTRYPGSLMAIRARSTRSIRPVRDSIERVRLRVPNQLETIEVIGNSYELTNRVALVQVTDLAVHARVSNEPGAVLVTDMTTGSPIAGAAVTVRDVRGREMASGATDSSGISRLREAANWLPLVRRGGQDESWSYWWSERYWGTNTARLVDVRRGNDRSVARLQSDAYSDWYAGAAGTEHPEAKSQLVRALTYTDRAIYRPRERVYVATIARYGWLGEMKTPPEGDSLRIRVAAVGDVRGIDAVRDTVVHLNRFGTAVDSFTLASGAPLGWYTARVDAMTPSGWKRRSSASFRVAEYRAPQFRASLAVDSGVRFLGDTIQARASGSYYFGAAMAGAVVHWSARTETAGGVDIPTLPAGFVVANRYGAGWDRPVQGGAVSGTDTLDARGTVDLTMPTMAGTLSGPGLVTMEVAVEDFDRQTAVAEQSTILHSSSFYIAVRDSGTSWYWRQGQRKTFGVLAITPSGRRVAGARIGLTITRRRPTWASGGGYGVGAWRWMVDTVSRDSTVTADSIVRVSFTPARDGVYEVEFTARDERSRPVATSVGAYVIPPQWFGGWGLDPSKLPIRLAQDTVAPGDSAKVSVLSPFPRAEAWVTVEREGMLAQLRRTVLQGETTFKIPVDDRFIPGAEISVLLVNAAPAWQTDSVHRRIRSGSVDLAVDKSSKALAVEIQTDAAQYAPGDSVRLTITVRDRRGRPVVGQVGVWAVDESVLALTDSARLSPLDSMYERRWSGFALASTATPMASLGRILSPRGWVREREALYGLRAANPLAVTTATGAGSTTVEIIPRTDFRTTAFYLTSLETDANGVVTAAARLPDNLTRYRVIAVAVDRGDRFGAAEASLVITKPLIARAALPRFIRSGDQFVAGAVITNQTGGDVRSTVTASARAATLETQDAVERPVANGASAEVRFGWRASAAPGDTASFRFAVRGGDGADAVETSVVTRAPYSPRFHAMTGVTKGDETVRMLLPPGIDPARSRLTLRVGTTPVAAVRAAYDQLRFYPYLCTEQLASRGRAIIAMLRLELAGLLDSLTAPPPSVLRGELQWVADELTRRQTPEGGAGYWSGTSWTSYPLSAYAGLVLLDARDLGTAVRPVVLQRIADYVREAFEDSPILPDSNPFGPGGVQRARGASYLGGRLAALQYLRRAGFADTVREDELAANSRRMAWEDRVWLVELLSHRQDRSAARRMLAEVWRDVEIAGTRVDIPDSLLNTFGFRSHVRPVARLLQATMAVDPDHPQLARLVERIAQQGRATRDRLWNTQDYAAEADALTRVALWQRSSAPAPVVVVQSARRQSAGREVLRSVAGRSGDTSIALNGLVERDGDWTVLPLRIVAGDSRVFYALTVEEVPLQPPTTPDVKGIVVERWYERFDDGRPASEVKEGDLVRARLRITIPSDREFVAVADPLPAGLEVVDLSLRTSRTIGPFESDESRAAKKEGDRTNAPLGGYYGSWYGGWWSPWEHREVRDDRVLYFARVLWKGTYTASYVARATTAGTFIRPPAHAEEMYNPSLGGRSDGGVFKVTPK